MEGKARRDKTAHMGVGTSLVEHEVSHTFDHRNEVVFPKLVSDPPPSRTSRSKLTVKCFVAGCSQDISIDEEVGYSHSLSAAVQVLNLRFSTIS